MIAAAVAGMAETKTAASVGVSIINAYGESMDNLGLRYDQLFLAIQNVRHREYFIDRKTMPEQSAVSGSLALHIPLLALYLVAVALSRTDEMGTVRMTAA